ncbi:unnamed protein product, partial [Nesidiocoris tenuis]
MKEEIKTNSSNTRQVQRDTAKKSVPLVLIRGKHCFRCGDKLHKNTNSCPALNSTCQTCGKRGHFLKTCIIDGRAIIQGNYKGQNKGQVNYIQNKNNDTSQESDSENDEATSAVASNLIRKTSKGKEVLLDVKLNGIKLQMLYDPGAASSIIGKKTW